MEDLEKLKEEYRKLSVASEKVAWVSDWVSVGRVMVEDKKLPPQLFELSVAGYEAEFGNYLRELEKFIERGDRIAATPWYCLPLLPSWQQAEFERWWPSVKKEFMRS